MWRVVLVFAWAIGLSGCSYFYGRPPSRVEPSVLAHKAQYTIGPGDQLQVFVWKNPELTVTSPVRPDGAVSVPLIQDVQAAGRTPAELSSVIATRLAKFVQDPQVTVTVLNAAAQADTSIKVIGEAQQPTLVPYHVGITLLEVMAVAGGLTDFADGNRAYLVRFVNGKAKRYHLRLASLLKSGDMSANIELAPGDVVSVPERWY